MSKMGGELATSLSLHPAARKKGYSPSTLQEVMKEAATGGWVGLAYSQGLALEA